MEKRRKDGIIGDYYSIDNNGRVEISDKYYYFICRFLNKNNSLSAKAYIYECNREDFSKLVLGQIFTITQDTGYTYTAPVEITAFHSFNKRLENGIDIKKVHLDSRGVGRRTNDERFTSKYLANVIIDEQAFYNSILLQLPLKAGFATLKRYRDIGSVIKDLREKDVAAEVALSQCFVSTNENEKNFKKLCDSANDKENIVTTAQRIKNVDLAIHDAANSMMEMSKVYGISSTALASTANIAPANGMIGSTNKTKLNTNTNTNTNTGGNTMKNLFGNMQFGKYEGDALKVSVKGLAVKSGNEYHVYDEKTNDITNIANFILGMDCLFLMPVAIKEIAKGDVVQHKEKFVIVKNIEGTEITVVDVEDGSVKTIIPTKSMFGFNFYTKVLNPMGNMVGTADENNPFGNMMPFLLMSEMGQKDGWDNSKSKSNSNDMMQMFMLMNMMNKESMGNDMMSNPMMLMMMMGGNQSMSDMMLPMMMMSGGSDLFGKAKECCGSCKISTENTPTT